VPNTIKSDITDNSNNVTKECTVDGGTNGQLWAVTVLATQYIILCSYCKNSNLNHSVSYMGTENTLLIIFTV